MRIIDELIYSIGRFVPKWFDLSKTEPLLEDEADTLKGYLLKADVPYSLISDVEFRWCEAFGKEVNGCFSMFHPNTVYLTKAFRGVLDRLAATAAHELDHRRRFLRSPLLYIVTAVPVVRRFTIERTATIVENRVNDSLNIDEVFRL